MVRILNQGRKPCNGASPSGKAADFDSAIRRFESSRPSQKSSNLLIMLRIMVWLRLSRAKCTQGCALPCTHRLQKIMVCSNVSLRHSMFWWRKRIRPARGKPWQMVAFSLRTRDPALARRIGMRLNLACEEWSEAMQQETGFQEKIADMLRFYAERDLHDNAERLRTDLESNNFGYFDSRAELLKYRSTQNRIFAKMYALAGEEGPNCSYTPECDAGLAAEGYSRFERDKIWDRIGKGFIRALFVANCDGADMPETHLVDAAIRAGGVPVTSDVRQQVIAKFAAVKARNLDKFAELSRVACSDAPAAWRAAPATKRPLHCDSGPPPPFASADAILRGNLAGRVIFPDLGEGNADAQSMAGAVDGGLSQPETLCAAQETSECPKFDEIDSSFSASQGDTKPGARRFQTEGAQAPNAVGSALSFAAGAKGDAASRAAVFVSTAAPDATPHIAKTISHSPGLIDTAHTRLNGLGQLVEALIVSKGPEWTGKTANQHRLASRLLAAVAGTDDLARISQADIGQYRQNLSHLPKNYGKSPKDLTLPLKDILARSAKLKAEGRASEVGLAAPTINRHVTQLGSIVTFAKANGWSIGDQATFASMRANDRRRKGDLRNAFDVNDLKKLLMDATWTDSAVIHDAIYWVPILGIYTLARLGELVGMRVEDVELDKATILIRPNQERRLKNTASERTLPIHPEVLRLGFREYVEAIKARGSVLLFPELRARGAVTPLPALFDKKWVKVLDQALPEARKNNKTFHSFRHFGNTYLAECNTNDALRESLLGHEGKTVNTSTYKKRALADTLRPIVLLLPNVSEHLKPMPIRFSEG